MTDTQKQAIMANIQANPDASIIVISNREKGTIIIDGKSDDICILLHTLINRLPAEFIPFLVEQIKNKPITEDDNMKLPYFTEFGWALLIMVACGILLLFL